jgi:hypothetical protein
MVNNPLEKITHNEKGWKMDRVEEKLEAIKTISGILEGRGIHAGNTVCEHIVDALAARGWRGPVEIRWIKEMVFDQARMTDETNPYRKEEASV